MSMQNLAVEWCRGVGERVSRIPEWLEAYFRGGTTMALILFVEYHRAFRQSASEVMNQESDLEVVAQAGSVAEGRQRMAEGGIDAAIVDIPLPDEGAEELVRALHEANPSVPVLMLTHLEDREVVQRFLEAGASEVLPKSITFAETLAAVRRLRGGRVEEKEDAVCGGGLFEDPDRLREEPPPLRVRTRESHKGAQAAPGGGDRRRVGGARSRGGAPGPSPGDI